MELLKEIVEKTGCKIVLSSTWRLYEDGKTWLRRFFINAGIDPNIIIGETPSFSGLTPSGSIAERRDEIKAWLVDNPCDSFVIVDDDPDACIEGHFVQTNFKEGLTREKADDILSLFVSDI